MGPGGKKAEPKPEPKPDSKAEPKKPEGKKKGPQPPKLPDDTKDHKVPPELRDFVDCKGNRATLGGGKIDWLDLPGGIKPDVKVEKGAAAGKFVITVSLDIKVTTIDLEMPAEVKGGKLVVDTSKVPGKIPGIGNPKKSVDDWVKKLNDWFKHNKRQFGELTLKDGKLTVTKVELVGMAVPDGGWGTGQKVAAGVATVAVLTGVGVGIYALTNDGGGTTDVVTEEPAGADSPGPAADLEARIAALEGRSPSDLTPEVFAGTICLEHGANDSVIPIPLTIAAMPPGTGGQLTTFRELDGGYLAQFGSGPTGSVSGEGSVEAGRGVINIPITQFGTYRELTITGPDGQSVGLGPLAGQVPFEVGSDEVACPGVGSLEAAPPDSSGAQLATLVEDEFIRPFNEAVAAGDSASLVGILHPAVIERYGRPQCETSLDAFVADGGVRFSAPSAVTGPTPYGWTTDGVTMTIDGTYTVEVEATSGEGSQPQSIHITPVEDHFAFYSDCGAVM